MGYYNMDKEFDYSNKKEITSPSDSSNIPISEPEKTTVAPNISNDERIELLKKKIDYIKNKGGINNMFKQNRFSAKVGLVMAGVGFLYAWKTKKNLFWWSVGAGIGGLVIGNLLKNQVVTTKNTSTNINNNKIKIKEE